MGKQFEEPLEAPRRNAGICVLFNGRNYKWDSDRIKSIIYMSVKQSLVKYTLVLNSQIWQSMISGLFNQADSVNREISPSTPFLSVEQFCGYKFPPKKIKL